MMNGIGSNPGVPMRPLAEAAPAPAPAQPQPQEHVVDMQEIPINVAVGPTWATAARDELRRRAPAIARTVVLAGTTGGLGIATIKAYEAGKEPPQDCINAVLPCLATAATAVVTVLSGMNATCFPAPLDNPAEVAPQPQPEPQVAPQQMEMQRPNLHEPD